MKTFSKILTLHHVLAGLLAVTSLSFAGNSPGSLATNSNSKSSSRSIKDGIAQRAVSPSAIPAQGGVRSAAPAQVAGPTMIPGSSDKKLYWVGRASTGGYMGVWIDHAQAQVRTLRFFANKDGLTVMVTKQDEAGNPVASEFDFVTSAPQRIGRGSSHGIGFRTMVGPKSSPSALLPDPLLPAKLPKGLEADLRRIGADLDLLRKLKSLFEGLTAEQRILGAALGQNPSGDYGFPKRSSGPEEKIPASPGERFRQGGEASVDGDIKSETPAETAHHLTVRAITDPDEAEMTRQQAELDGRDRASQEWLPKHDPAPPGNPKEAGATYSYYVERRDGETYTRTRVDVSPLFGQRETVVSSGRSEADSAALAALRQGNEGEAKRLIAESRRRAGELRRVDIPDPARNPSEGGQHYGGIGVDPRAWGFLRGTGLATLLWNNWVAKVQHDFGDPLRQPIRGSETAATGRSMAPRPGRDSVINPSETGRGTRRTPVVPDLKDPQKPDEGGGRPGSGSRP